MKRAGRIFTSIGYFFYPEKRKFLFKSGVAKKPTPLFRQNKKSSNKLTQTQKESINKFNQMVAKGELSYQETDCLCGHSDFVEISNLDRYGLQQRTVVCKKCGLMMSNPHMTKQSFNYFYSTDLYRKVYQFGNLEKLAINKFKNNSGEFIFDDLFPLIKNKKNLKILEFGCGGGWNLAHFAKAGYKAVGYDYSPKVTEIGRNHGLDLRQGTISDIEGQYDIIIMNHVIEHFTDIFDSMTNIINKHLKPDGLIYLGVPNICNYSSQQLQNAHVYYFTPQTFKYFMSRCGLRQIKFGPAQNFHMYGVFELGSQNLDISFLESESKRILKIVRRVKFKEGVAKILDKLFIKGWIKSIMKKFYQ